MSTVIFGSAVLPAGYLPLAYLVIGEKPLLNLAENKALVAALPPHVAATSTDPLFHDLGVAASSERNGKGGIPTVTHYFTDAASGARAQLTFASFSAERSRLNAVIRSDLIFDVVSKNANRDVDSKLIICLKHAHQAYAASSAIARAFNLYSKKTAKPSPTNTVHVEFIASDGAKIDYNRIQHTANGVRFAAMLTDMPPSELNTTTYTEKALQIFENLKKDRPDIMSCVVKKGETLKNEGFGGLWGVGQAAEHLPALVVLSYTPKGAEKTVVCVGKGIVYDTGGLSIKSKDFMPTMKCDMGGSAAILASFEALVKLGFKHNLHAILCLAENSVDSKSFRNDDILYMYSGKTVEINNTDAEGRLVLADGVAYATKHLNPDYLFDMATLTGAQSYATGNIHSGCLSNDEGLERLLIKAGQQSGDLTFPLIYCPELLGISKQYGSEVADMKNSVKDRGNASSSGAGHFIEDHFVGEKWKWNYEATEKGSPKGLWAHLDIAAPAFTSGRATGYGVSLLVEALQQL